jgi:thymidylate kinase
LIKSGGIWVSIDGPEGSGKSVTAGNLLILFPDALVVPEFSETEMGHALARAVIVDPRIYLKAPVSEALFFLADYIYQCETTVLPALASNRMVISDRGFLSKWSYQAAVLAGSMPNRKAHELLDIVLTSVHTPDLSIVLDCPPTLLRNRLVKRDGGCSEGRYQFILRVQQEFEIGIRRHSRGVVRISQDETMTASELGMISADIIRNTELQK